MVCCCREGVVGVFWGCFWVVLRVCLESGAGCFVTDGSRCLVGCGSGECKNGESEVAGGRVVVFSGGIEYVSHGGGGGCFFKNYF